MERKKHLSLKRLIGLCKRVEDPRRIWGNKRHELVDILVIALLAIISGCEGFEEIHDYAAMKKSWLRSFLRLPGGIPSISTFQRAFARIKPQSLEEMYRAWIYPYIGSCVHKQVCVDGKTVRGANRRSAKHLHMVSAWVREDGIALGQVKTDEKSNEITAIPQLLAGLDIYGAVVTIDAIGCQREIAQQIIEQHAHYLLAVKGNHPTLYEEVDAYFRWAQEDNLERKRLSHHTETSFEHGRTVRYHAMVTQDVVWFQDKAKWKSLRTFVCIERTREENGNISTQRAYYISSLDADAESFLRLTRGHWSVENQLHWMLDVAFHEDACTIHSDHSPQNISLLRKMALFLLRLETSVKASIARKRRMAAYDNDFAFSVLGGK